MRPEPCGAPPFPELTVGPDDFAAIDANEDGTPDVIVAEPATLASLAAWVVAVADWHDAVMACPYLRPGADLRDAVGGGARP